MLAANFCHSSNTKLLAVTFLSITIFQRETPLFMTHPLCGSSVPVTQILISTLNTSIMLRYWPRPRIIPPEALCRVLVGISCQLESDSVHWVKEGGKKVCIYNTSIKMTPPGYLRYVLKQSHLRCDPEEPGCDGFVNTFFQGIRRSIRGKCVISV